MATLSHGGIFGDNSGGATPQRHRPSTRPAWRSSVSRAPWTLGRMNGPVSKLVRCAIYTRKSTEYNLELAFNSLDAQREACEAYIKSQAHEGWCLIPSRYDDGAFSGASLDRPALRQLLADVRAGKIDIVLVYKVDRLTRSLADFAKLIELFDVHGVSFVSVTQSFNTSSSMGRLTLNVLLSFAQFERELIGERVRDKIAASKRKGLWVGGPVPLGYAAVDKKILVVPAEAAAVRTIFARYLELGSVRALAEDLDRRGIRSKPRRRSTGRTVGGGRFGVGALAYLLKNRFYIGELVYRGEVHHGEHEPILDSALFEAVGAKLAAQAVERRCRLRGLPAILSGRLFDHRGNRMSPTHANKRGARYRYYVSQAVLQGKPPPPGLVNRVPAAEIEALAVAALRNHLNARGGGEGLPDNDRGLLERHLERVTLTPNHLELRLRELVEPTQAHDPVNDGSSGPPIANVTTITVPWSSPVPAAVKGIIHVPAHNTPIKAGRREALLIAIVKARQWIDDLAHGRAASFAVIARREGKAERHIRLLAPLAFVSPRIVSALLDGTAPADLTLTKLARALPYCWAEQERRVGTSAPFHG
jgi:DNA invertase Pin-like site-specific DNA recombinase